MHSRKIYKIRDTSNVLLSDGINFQCTAYDSDVTGILVVRNEIVRLPHVIRHHENLGVRSFVAIDNGSTDGTREFLRGRSNVSLVETDQSFASSGFGMDWVVSIMNQNFVDRWCLLIDGDESFVYPYCENVKIDQLCRFLDLQGDRAVSAMCIDMYPRRTITSDEDELASSLLEQAPYFDPIQMYSIRANEENLTQPDWIAHGGPRARLFFQNEQSSDAVDFDEYGYLKLNSDVAEAVARGEFRSGYEHYQIHGRAECRVINKPPLLSTIPLIKWHKEYQYHVCRHLLVGEQQPSVSPIRGALLHFKLLHDFRERARIESERGEHWDNAIEYRRYNQIFDNHPELRAWHPNSVRYESSHTLMEQGLIHTTAEFDVWAIDRRSIP